MHEQRNILEGTTYLWQLSLCAARACEDLAGEQVSGVSFDNTDCLLDCEMFGILVVVQMLQPLGSSQLFL